MKHALFILLALAAFAFAQNDSAKAAPAATPTPADYLLKRIETLAGQPGNALTKQLLAKARVSLEYWKSAEKDDPNKALYESATRSYTTMLATQLESVRLQREIDSIERARIATQAEIVGIQGQIISIEEGKAKSASNLAASLDAERQKLARQNASTQEQLAQQAKELATKDSLLAAERAKAEARQEDARKQLDRLQNQFVNVRKDARGIILSMSDLLFDKNKSALTENLKINLAGIAGVLSTYTQANVIVEGHTDSTGTAEHNQKLSEDRAKTVMDFLVSRGIAAARLTAVGYGKTRPVADNTTKEGQAKNRRVDLIIQDKELR
jgi:outer membrane protein OmpA-like peptidoglycan-associated protein